MFQRLFIFLCLWLPVCAVAWNGQSPVCYRCITMDNGMPSNTIKEIDKDQRGLMWFATEGGLCSYDGISVHHFPITKNGLSQYVSAMSVTAEGIFVGTEKGILLFHYDTEQFSTITEKIHSLISSMVYGNDGTLWISTMGEGIYSYSTKTRRLKRYQVSGQDNQTARLYLDKNGQLWAVSSWGSVPVVRYDKMGDRFVKVAFNTELKSFGSLCMLQTGDDTFWLGSWERGLLRMSENGSLEQVLSAAGKPVGWHIYCLYELSTDAILIGCDDGVILFHPSTSTWEYLLGNDRILQPDRFAYSITSDREGGIWIGTFYGGAIYISPIAKRFTSYTSENCIGLSGNVIGRFCEDGQGRLWIASDDGGLLCFSMKEQRFVDYPGRQILSKINAHALCMDGKDLWIGTYSKGVYVLNMEKGTVRNYMNYHTDNSLDDNSSYAIFKDRGGQIWVGTMRGICIYNRDKDNFIRMKTQETTTIDIDEDAAGNMWFATLDRGLWRYTAKTKEWKAYSDGKEGSLLPSLQVNTVYIDNSHHLWAGTLNGLYIYDAEKDIFRQIKTKGYCESISSMVDIQGVMWLATDHGIVRYIHDEGLLGFNREDGLACMQFQPNAGLLASDGKIYFGSFNGFCSFMPRQFKVNGIVPPVIFSSLEIFGKQVHVGDSRLPMSLNEIPQLNLSYKEKMFAISFAALSYCSPGKNRYAYKLEGFDKDWIYVNSEDKAVFTNIPPGTYVFKVKATNNDGIWSEEASLKIVVHPPFWLTLPARILYLLCFFLAVYYYVHFRIKRTERLQHEKIQRLNEIKEKEIHDARLSFFTMIAHEIRTPVTLIIGPLEEIMRQQLNKNPQEVSSNLEIIDRNAQRLLSLVNQLLDFRKVEQHNLVTHFDVYNIHQLLQKVCERFQLIFEQNGKEFHVDYPEASFSAIVDAEALTKVVSNLLSNAVKYAKSSVSLRCMTIPGEENFAIEVKDDGVGIKEEDLEKIFQPFYQTVNNKPGTGIGLAIVKNIVEDHRGHVDVHSEFGKGTCFTVVLPIRQVVADFSDHDSLSCSSADTHPESVVSGVHDEKDATNLLAVGKSVTEPLPAMLIVDDNEDMVSYISQHLKNHYRIFTAHNGMEALEQMKNNSVSIIVSDWMMPHMSGVELCKIIRSNADTSHIPFILLTAKTDDESKIEGMDCGADIYIEKPFSMQYLEASIRNNLNIRRKLREKYSSTPLEPVTSIASTPVDHDFLVRLNNIIEENLHSPNLNVAFLMEKLNVSRSGLFGKLKALAGVTPNEMIMLIRLKKAAALLHEGSMPIGEVGYAVGFNSPSYFSKRFQKQFGITPTEFIKQKTGQ